MNNETLSVLNPNEILAAYCPGSADEEAYLALVGVDDDRTAAIKQLVDATLAGLAGEGFIKCHHATVVMGEVQGSVQVLLMIEPEASQSELVALIVDACGSELGFRPDVTPVLRPAETRSDLRRDVSRLLENAH